MNKKDNSKLIVSIVLNLLIFAMVVFSTIVMFTDFKFTHGKEPVLESHGISMFKFFTVDSNIFMGIVSLLFAIKEIMMLKDKTSNISTKLYILKLMATTGVGVTFAVVFLYLGHIVDGGMLTMLQNSNLFYHLIIPVFSFITFIFFERTTKLKFKYTLYGLVPTVLYAAYYLINALTHIENGKVSPLYDWYWFIQGGLWQIAIVIPAVFILTYVISLLLWKFNKKIIGADK